MRHTQSGTESPTFEIDEGAGKRGDRASPSRALIAIGLLCLVLSLIVVITLSLFSEAHGKAPAPTTADGKKQEHYLQKKRQEDEKRLRDMEDKLVENPGTDRTSFARSMIKEFERLYEQEKEKDQAEQGAGSFQENVKNYAPFADEYEQYKGLRNGDGVVDPLPGAGAGTGTGRVDQDKKSMLAIADEAGGDEKGGQKETPVSSHTPISAGIIPTGTPNSSLTLRYNDPFPLLTIYEGEFLEGVILTAIRSDIQQGPVIARTSRDFFDDSGTYVIIPYGTTVLGKTQAISYRGQQRLYIWFERIILPERRAGENRASITLSSRGIALDQQGINGLVSKVERHFWLQYGSAILLGMLDGLTSLAHSRIHTNDLSIMVDETGSNLSGLNDSRLNRYSNIVPTVEVKAGTKVKIYLTCDIHISAFDLIQNRPYARSMKGGTND